MVTSALPQQRVEAREGEVRALYTLGVDRIEDKAVRDAVETILRSVVDPQFWVGPASSSGKYHPTWQNETSGLVRHTVEMCALAPQIARMFADLCTPDGKDVDPYHLDLILAAIVLHDCMKGGRPWGAYTSRAHAGLAASAWEQAASVRNVDPKKIKIIKDAVLFHEGRWSTDPLPPDVSSHILAVHTADMISSAKDLEKVFLPKRFADTATAVPAKPQPPHLHVVSSRAPEDDF